MSKIDPCDVLSEDGTYKCPYADTYTGYESEMCRNCCGKGVDEDSYPEEDYEEYSDDSSESGLSLTEIYNILRAIGETLDPYDVGEEEYEQMYADLCNDEQATLKNFFETTDEEEVRECLIGAEADKELADYDVLLNYYQTRYCA